MKYISCYEQNIKSRNEFEKLLARVEKLEREKDQEIESLKEEVLKVQREKNENINRLEAVIRKLENGLLVEVQ